jgi:hypothetical protein
MVRSALIADRAESAVWGVSFTVQMHFVLGLGVADRGRAAYVAGIVHWWDRWPALQVPAVPGGNPMTATIPSAAVVPVQPVFTDAASRTSSSTNERLLRERYRAGRNSLMI